MSSRLSNLKPIRCISAEDGTEWRVPPPLLFSNIPMLSDFLVMVVQDWERECAPFQEAADEASTKAEELFHIAKAQIALEPYFLKCLFSYVLFFISLQCAYELLYNILKMLNRDLNLKLKPQKKPRANLYVRKVKIIRDLSVSHLLSPKKRPKKRDIKSEINAFSAAMWQPLTLQTDSTDTFDLKCLSFHMGKIVSRDSAGKITESDDISIEGIPQMHKQCMEYIDKFDSVCAEYLNKIKAQLPITVSNVQYVGFQNSSTGVSNP